MHRSCADVDLRDYRTLTPWVWDCIKRHHKRSDFRNMLLQYGISEKTYKKAVKWSDASLLYPAVEPVARYAADCIASRTLVFKPPYIRIRKDPANGKIRPIGCECPENQIFDSIAIHAAMEIWNRRIVPQQVSSIPGRGPLLGAKTIRHWVLKDNRAMRYAKAHGVSYASACKYHAKLDATLCFPLAELEVFMALFRKDCANRDLIWLWETLLKFHRVGDYKGFLIGSSISAWAMQYMISFLYREMMNLSTERRGKHIRMVTHMITFMDDMLLTGSNRKNLKSAIRKAVKFAKDKLHITLKGNWHIKALEEEPIDMMGYVIHRNGKMTIRARNYIHGRRLVLTYYREHALNVQQARRLTSYKGFFKHTKLTYVRKWEKDDKKLQIAEAMNYAAGIISRFDREVNNGRILRESTIQRTAGAGKIQDPPGRESRCLDPS